jgi:hypothetical protein
MLSVVHGVGRHPWELSDHEVRTALFVRLLSSGYLAD